MHREEEEIPTSCSWVVEPRQPNTKPSKHPPEFLVTPLELHRIGDTQQEFLTLLIPPSFPWKQENQIFSSFWPALDCARIPIAPLLHISVEECGNGGTAMAPSLRGLFWASGARRFLVVREPGLSPSLVIYFFFFYFSVLSTWRLRVHRLDDFQISFILVVKQYWGEQGVVDM